MIYEGWFTAKQKAELCSSQWYERTGKTLPTLDKPKNHDRFKKTAMIMIENSQYKALINLLKGNSARFRQAWLNNLQKVIRQEMNTLSHIKNLFPTSCIEGSVFNWDSVLQHIKSTAPTVFTVFQAALLRKLNRYTYVSTLSIKRNFWLLRRTHT